MYDMNDPFSPDLYKTENMSIPKAYLAFLIRTFVDRLLFVWYNAGAASASDTDD